MGFVDVSLEARTLRKVTPIVTEYVTARRPWTAAEIAASETGPGNARPHPSSHPCSARLAHPPARCDLDLETYLLADLLGITEAQLMAWEEDSNLLPSPENEMYRRFISCVRPGLPTCCTRPSGLASSTSRTSRSGSGSVPSTSLAIR